MTRKQGLLKGNLVILSCFLFSFLANSSATSNRKHTSSNSKQRRLSRDNVFRQSSFGNRHERTPGEENKQNPEKYPTSKPSPAPTVIRSRKPSIHPTATPSTEPSDHPSAFPSTSPTKQPIPLPSTSPTLNPTPTPSEAPTFRPSFLPSSAPSESPSFFPSNSPTKSPSMLPSMSPTLHPSRAPSETPSLAPSQIPSNMPSQSPSKLPSTPPSQDPSMLPSASPTSNPSQNPSESPSLGPSGMPSFDCSPNATGFIGSPANASVQIEYIYEIETDPSKGGDMVNNILPALERAINDKLLSILFPLKCGDDKNDRSRRLHLVGISSRPEEMVLEGVSCQLSLSNSSHECAVVDGGAKLFVDGNASDTKREVLDAIKDGMDNDKFLYAHGAIVRLTFTKISTEGISTQDADVLSTRSSDNNTSVPPYVYVAGAGAGALLVAGAVVLFQKKRKEDNDEDDGEEDDSSEASSYSEGGFP